MPYRTYRSYHTHTHTHTSLYIHKPADRSQRTDVEDRRLQSAVCIDYNLQEKQKPVLGLGRTSALYWGRSQLRLQIQLQIQLRLQLSEKSLFAIVETESALRSVGERFGFHTTTYGTN